MHKFLMLASFVLSLFGCDIGGSTVVHRSSEDGRDTLYSRIRIKDGSARFDCIASASGRCHYTLFAENCADVADAGCARQPLQRFDVIAGQTRDIAGLAGFTPCVSIETTAMKADCTPRNAAAAKNSADAAAAPDATGKTPMAMSAGVTAR
jgi:hypothetical protein